MCSATLRETLIILNHFKTVKMFVCIFRITLNYSQIEGMARKPGKVFVVCFCWLFWGLPCTKLGKTQKLYKCSHTTNQWKHCDFVIHAWSMNIKQKMCRAHRFTLLMSRSLQDHFWCEKVIKIGQI